MEINIFSGLEIKNKIYGKTLQTIDNFFADMRFQKEGAPPTRDITEDDIITLEDYEHLDSFFMSSKVDYMR